MGKVTELGRHFGSGYPVIYVDTIADLQALSVGELVDGQQVQVKEYHAGTGVGGGEFYWDAVSTDTENGGTVIGDAAQGRWKRDLKTVFVSQFGANPSASNNAPEIQAAHDYVVTTKGAELVYDALYQTTETINYNGSAIHVRGLSKGAWLTTGDNDTGIQFNGTLGNGVLISGTGYTLENHKYRGVRGQASNLIECVDSSTQLTLRDIRIQDGGVNGISFTSGQAGESSYFDNIEVANCYGSGIYVNLASSLNNITFNKVNSHRNRLHGAHFVTGVDRLTITNGCDFTLNRSVAGVSSGIRFEGPVNSTSIVSECWFEDNEVDIYIDTDSPVREVKSRNNKFSDTRGQASIYCKNGRIDSEGDSFSTYQGNVFQIDVSTYPSKITSPSFGVAEPGFSELAGDLSNVNYTPLPAGQITKHYFKWENVAGGTTTVATALPVGASSQKVSEKDKFYRVRLYAEGVAITSGSAQLKVFKSTISNDIRGVSAANVSINATKDRDEFFYVTGDNNFRTSSNFDSYGALLETTADWDGTSGVIEATVEVIENLQA